MKRKVIAALMAATMVLGLAACGSSGGDSGDGGSGGSSSGSDGNTIRLVNGKIEIDGTLKKLAEMYKEETAALISREPSRVIIRLAICRIFLSMHLDLSSRTGPECW